jgi:hypothetical protein
VPCEIKFCKRHAQTNGAVEELKAVPRSRNYLLGAELSGADVQLSFVGQLVGRWAPVRAIQTLEAWVRGFQSRPAYLVAVARRGAYALAE